MNTAKISSKYQICVPKEIRDQLHIKPGQVFVLIAKGDCLEMVPKRELKDIRGILAGANVNNIRDRNDRI
jgi:AbrB family looped-hinge helix DNA binding protein